MNASEATAQMQQKVGKVANKLGLDPKVFLAASAALVVVIIAAIIIIVAVCSGGAQKAALNYRKALLAGELEDANKYSDSDLHDINKAIIKMLEKGDDTAHFNRITIKQSIENIKDGYVIQDKDYATVYNKYGTPMFSLKKVNGKWKVVYSIDIVK